MRYFVWTDANNDPLRLWRFDLDNIAKELHEAIWLDGAWVPRFGVALPIDPDYDEVTPYVAQRLFPDAFAVSPE